MNDLSIAFPVHPKLERTPQEQREVLQELSVAQHRHYGEYHTWVANRISDERNQLLMAIK